MKKQVTYLLKENGMISGYQWLIDNPKANVVICHGMAEHIERYDEFALYLNSQGYNVLVITKEDIKTQLQKNTMDTWVMAIIYKY